MLYNNLRLNIFFFYGFALYIRVNLKIIKLIKEIILSRHGLINTKAIAI